MPALSEQTTPKHSTLAEKLEKLARIIPGIAGYQDREKMRESDKQVRLHLADKIRLIKKTIVKITQCLAEKKKLSILLPLDQFAGELTRMGDSLKYAPYGYRGVFDHEQADLEALDKIYSFDLSLIEQVEKLHTEAMELNKQGENEEKIREGLKGLEKSYEDLEEILSRRNNSIHIFNKETKA